MHGHLGVVRAGLHAQVAAAAGGIELVGGEVRKLAKGGGSPGGQAEPVGAVGVLEQAGPEAEGEGQLGRRQPERLAGVGGRGHVGLRPVAADRASLSHPRGRPGPRAQQVDECLAGVGGDVEGGEVQPVLGRRDDAGLMSSAVAGIERVGARRRCRGAGRVRGLEPADEAGGADRGPGTDQTEQSAPAQALAGPSLTGHRVTVAVSCDSGSDRALTASESSLTSSSDSAV